MVMIGAVKMTTWTKDNKNIEIATEAVSDACFAFSGIESGTFRIDLFYDRLNARLYGQDVMLDKAFLYDVVDELTRRKVIKYKQGDYWVKL